MQNIDTKTSKSIVGGLSWTLAEKILTDLFESVISILLARFLFPEDYGMISLVQIFITISQIFIGCGLGASLVQNKDSDEEQSSTVFYLNLILGVTLYVVLFVSAPFIAKIKNIPDLKQITRVLALKVPIASIYSIQYSYVQKKMDFKKFFYSSLLGTLIAGIVGVTMAFNGYGAWSLVAYTLIDQFVDCFVLFITTKWFPKPMLKLDKTKTMLSFGSKVLFSELIGRIYEQIRPLVIAIKYTVADLAFNSKGQKYAYMPISLINSSIIRVMFPTLSSLQNDDEKMIEVAKKTLQVSFFIVSPVLIGLAAISNTLIPFVFTEKWTECVPFLQVYCFIYLSGPLTTLDYKLLEAKGKSETSIKAKIFEVCVELLCICFTVFMFDDPLSIAIGVLAVRILAIYFICYLCEKELNYGFIEHMKMIMPSFLLSLFMGTIVYLMNMLEFNVLFKLVIQVFVGMLVYSVSALIFRLDAASFIINFVKNSKDENE